MNIAQHSIVQQLRSELGASEATEHLIDWLLDSWSTLEILRDRFGESRALDIFTAYAPARQTRTQEATMVWGEVRQYAASANVRGDGNEP